MTLRDSDKRTRPTTCAQGQTGANGLPTVVLFSPGPHAGAAPHRWLPLYAPVITAPTWACASTVAQSADVLVLAPGGDTEERLRLVRAYRMPTDRSAGGGEPTAARVLVTPPTRVPLIVCAPAAEHDVLVRAGATHVVDVDAHAITAVWATVQSTTTTALLTRIAAVLPELRLGSALRSALNVLCLNPFPPASVTALCAAVGAHRRTLWYQWGVRTRACEPRPRLEDALTAVVFARAMGLWSAGATWSHTAELVGVHRHTLARAAVRIAGLAKLPVCNGPTADAAHAAVRDALSSRLMRPVLRRAVL